MATSQNGWAAFEDRRNIKTYTVPGTKVKLPLNVNSDVATVLLYVAEQFNLTVQTLNPKWCWGFAFRPVRGQTTGLSNHASGTGEDLNAPNFPRGVRTVKCMTSKQISACRKIVRDLRGAVRWGGDYTGTQDAMHFEINCGPEFLKKVADDIRSGAIGKPPVKTKLQRLQTLLGLPADNIWGPRTEAAAQLFRQEAKDPKIRNLTKIKEFQRIVKTTSITGIWGSQTDGLFLALRKAHKK